MNLLGVHLTLWLGRNEPSPASVFVAEALQSVEVTHTDQGTSGFQLMFHIGRSSIIDLMDYRLLKNDDLKPFSRVILLVRFAIAPQVLMDGIITNQQLSPSNEPGASTFTVTGEDVSVMMDLEEKRRPFPAQSDNVIVAQLIAGYGQYGIAPFPLPTPVPYVRSPQEGTQHQPNYTDRAYIQELASRHGFVFYITPGPAPRVNRAYWGPPNRLDIPQSALSLNMGPNTNVDSINFRYNALAPNRIKFAVDRIDQIIEASNRSPLVSNRAELRRTKILSEIGGLNSSPLSDRAQSMVNESLDEVVTANGELDALRYNGLLQPRTLVDLRGAGRSYDGQYYVKSVTHRISKGMYKQSFTLTREGTGSLTPFVRP